MSITKYSLRISTAIIRSYRYQAIAVKLPPLTRPQSKYYPLSSSGSRVLELGILKTNWAQEVPTYKTLSREFQISFQKFALAPLRFRSLPFCAFPLY